MILHRCFPRDRGARPNGAGGPLWIARVHQGEGRHDNPEHFGCLYLADRETAGVVEWLAVFVGEPGVDPSMLERNGRTLAVAAIELADGAELVDLDHPPTLARERLRPSLVATRERVVTQPQALRIWKQRPSAAGISWWSTFESLWACVTLFDRAAPLLRVLDVRELTVDDPAVVEAAELLGMV